MQNFFSPGNITHYSKDQKNQVLKAGEYEVFVKIQRNGSQIGDDPPGPVFQFLFVHQPHARERSGGSKTVGDRHSAVGKSAEQQIKDNPTSGKKEQTVSPVSF
jgi:hypothetical protein